MYKDLELINMACEDVKNLICDAILEQKSAERTKLLMKINGKIEYIQQKSAETDKNLERMVSELCVKSA